MKKELYEKIIKKFCFENFQFENLCIEIPDGMLKTIRREYELIVCNSKRIIFFVQVSDVATDSEVIALLRTSLNSLANKISVSLNNFIVCGLNNSQVFFFNKYNDRLFKISLIENDNIVEYIENDLYGPEVFNYDSLRKISDILSFSSTVVNKAESKEKVKYTSEGKILIKKHGTWREASELNSDNLFALTALGGMLGMHLFYQKKRGKAFLYLFSLGFFGIGWFFDCLEILFGIYKDREGRYLVPLQNKIFAVVLLLFGVIVFCGVYFLSMYVLKLLPNIIQQIVNSIFG